MASQDAGRDILLLASAARLIRRMEGTWQDAALAAVEGMSADYADMYDGQYVLDTPPDELRQHWMRGLAGRVAAGDVEIASVQDGFGYCSWSEWDSRYFQKRMARIEGLHGANVGSATAVLRSLLQRLGDQGAEHISIRLPATSHAALNACIGSEFAFLHSKVLLRAAHAEGFTRHGALRPFRPEDSNSISGLMGRAMVNNRFAFDSALDSSFVPGVYEQWFSSIQTTSPDSIKVLDDSTRFGCICTRTHSLVLPSGTKHFGFVDLVVVDPGSQGQGAGQLLISEAVADLFSRGCVAVYANTSQHSVSSLLAFQRAGFSAYMTLLEFRKTRVA